MPGLKSFVRSKTQPLLLALLLTSCGTNYPVIAPTEPCRVPPVPTLDVSPVGCGESVCYSVEDQLELVIWEQAMWEYTRAVTMCPHVLVTE